MVKKNRGFTLVELVISVAVFALVIVVAVPKMVNQNSLEERVVVDQAAGYFGSAVALGHAAWVVAGRPSGASTIPGFRQGTLDFSASGWPIGAGASEETLSATSCAKLWGDIQDFERSVSTRSAGERSDFIASTNQNSCVYELSSNTDRRIEYNTETGKILVTNS